MGKFGWAYLGCGNIAHTTARELIKTEDQQIIARGGAEYLDSGITLGVDNTWQFWMHDPDGNPFEIMEYTPQSLQVVGMTHK